jgi:hypothetical protein
MLFAEVEHAFPELEVEHAQDLAPLLDDVRRRVERLDATRALFVKQRAHARGPRGLSRNSRLDRISRRPRLARSAQDRRRGSYTHAAAQHAISAAIILGR